MGGQALILWKNIWKKKRKKRCGGSGAQKNDGLGCGPLRVSSWPGQALLARADVEGREGGVNYEGPVS